MTTIHDPQRDDPDATLRPMSVMDLLDRIKSDRGWRVSIAQRPFEWDENRVTNLVDSLLRGFPIGSILTIDSERSSYALGVDKGLRKAAGAPQGRGTQVLDGQQRCASILATFGGKGLPDRHGGGRRHLFVNVSELNPAAYEMEEIDAPVFHFQWASVESLNGLDPAQAKREGLPRSIPTSGWVLFWKAVGHVIEDAATGADRIAVEAGRRKRAVVAELASKLAGALCRRSIPVHNLHGTDTQLEDLHRVFIRINTGGLALSAVDAFFAGVKYYWTDAEEQIGRLTKGGVLLGRRAAITVLGRCAAMSLKPGAFDPVRLNLRHLAQARGVPGSNRLVRRMRALTEDADGHKLRRAIEWVSRVVNRGLRQRAASLPSTLLSVPIGWAYQTLARGHKLPRIDSREATAPILAFLFWPRVLGSARYGRTRFERETFKQAWSAATKGKPFPHDIHINHS